MMYKKVTTTYFAVFLGLTLGCGLFSAQICQSQDVKKNWAYAVGGSTSGSTAYAYTVGFVTVANKYLTKGKLSVSETGGAVGSITNLRRKSIDIGVSISATVADALEGKGPYKDIGPFSELRYMQRMYDSPWNMVVRKDSGILTPNDFKGKRIGSPPVGSQGYLLLQDVLSAYGISERDVRLHVLTGAEQATALVDGNLDVICVFTGIPTGYFLDASTSRDLRWIEISDEKRDEVLSKHPLGYYGKAEIPAKSYKGIDAPVKTLSSVIVYVTTKDASEEAIYEITKTFWQNKKEIDQTHPTVKLTKTQDFQTFTPCAPYHPGVLRFLKEAGISFKPFK